MDVHRGVVLAVNIEREYSDYTGANNHIPCHGGRSESHLGARVVSRVIRKLISADFAAVGNEGEMMFVLGQNRAQRQITRRAQIGHETDRQGSALHLARCRSSE